MDKPGSKKISVVRTRVPSNSSTPGMTRGTSTPTGSSSKNRSFNFSPITNPDLPKSAAVATERLEPKLLKPLGPTFPHGSNEKKNLQVKGKSVDDQAALLYMAYQQQKSLNNAFDETTERIRKESKKQLEDLWALVRLKEGETNKVKERPQIVKHNSELQYLANQLEPTLKQSIDNVSRVIPLIQQLAEGLDVFRHQIQLDEINKIKNEEKNEIANVFKKSGDLCESIKLDELNQVTQVASSISELDGQALTHIKTMEECQKLTTQTITRLGQEMTLDEGKTVYKRLSELSL